MAMKPMLLALAYALLVTIWISHFVEAMDTEHDHAKSPTKAPIHPSEKPHHHHAPEKAPPPHHHHHHHHHHHGHAPIHSPVRAETPVASVAPKHGCLSTCDEYCKKEHHEKKDCVKACTACCDKCKCVPLHNKKCSNWDHVKLDGKFVKCP